MTQKNFLPVAYHQGVWKPFTDANISIATHALHYGTGAFGGMRAIPDPEKSDSVLLFRLDRHAKRLADSARFLGYDITSEEIAETIREFVRRNKPQKPIYIRPLIYTSDLDLSPRLHDIEIDFLIYGLEL
jgi:branched-chain amino acid aminotransferase